jgi:predicted DNA-binding protein
MTSDMIITSNPISEVQMTKRKPLKLVAFRMPESEISELKELSKNLGIKPWTLVRDIVSDRLKAS